MLARLVSGILLFAALLIIGTGRAGAEPFVVAVNNAPPYRIVEDDNNSKKYSGIYVDFVRELARRAKISVEFREVPFARALKLMRGGQADVMAGPNRTAEREKFMIYLDEELPRERKVFYTSLDGPKITKYEDLKTLRLAVLQKSVYFSRFDQDGSLNKYQTPNYETALRMLDKGRVDAVIIPELLGDYLVKKGGFDVVKAEFTVEGKPSFITLSRASPLVARIEDLQAVIRTMKADGTVTKIISAYTIRN